MAKLNPVFSGIRVEEGIETAASVKGVAGKTLFLLGVAVLSAIVSITVGASAIATNPLILFIAMIGALICGVAGQVSAKAAKVCSVIYTVLALVFIFLGTLASNELVWELTDAFNYLMVLPNAIALFALTGMVKSSLGEADK